MNTLHKEYRQHRAEHPDLPASQALAYVKARAVTRAKLILLGAESLPSDLRRQHVDTTSEVEVNGVTFYVELWYDNDWIDDDQYTLEWLRGRPDHGEEGWGRTGRKEGSYLRYHNRDWVRVTLHDGALHDWLPYYRKSGMSEQMAFEKACRTQDNMREHVDDLLNGNACYYGYTLHVEDPADGLREMVDSCSGYDDQDCMVDDIVGAILRSL